MFRVIGVQYQIISCKWNIIICHTSLCIPSLELITQVLQNCTWPLQIFFQRRFWSITLLYYIMADCVICKFYMAFYWFIRTGEKMHIFLFSYSFCFLFRLFAVGAKAQSLLALQPRFALHGYFFIFNFYG